MPKGEAEDVDACFTNSGSLNVDRSSDIYGLVVSLEGIPPYERRTSSNLAALTWEKLCGIVFPEYWHLMELVRENGGSSDKLASTGQCCIGLRHALAKSRSFAWPIRCKFTAGPLSSRKVLYYNNQFKVLKIYRYEQRRSLCAKTIRIWNLCCTWKLEAPRVVFVA